MRASGFLVELRGDNSISLQTIPSDQSVSDTSFDAIVPSIVNNQQVQTGIYDLVVTNPNGRSTVKQDAFRIGFTPPITPTQVITP